MNHPRYKATIFLAPIKDENGERHPCVSTHSSLNKQEILNFVLHLLGHGVICAYRMLYSPDGDENNYYFDTEVVYLPDGAKHFSVD